jgi:hypothetical protein
MSSSDRKKAAEKAADSYFKFAKKVTGILPGALAGRSLFDAARKKSDKPAAEPAKPAPDVAQSKGTGRGGEDDRAAPAKPKHPGMYRVDDSADKPAAEETAEETKKKLEARYPRREPLAFENRNKPDFFNRAARSLEEVDPMSVRDWEGDPLTQWTRNKKRKP